jgi:hypothetical protein
LRATATQAEQEAQYLQDNPQIAARALQEDAEKDAAASGEGSVSANDGAAHNGSNGDGGTAVDAGSASGQDSDPKQQDSQEAVNEQDQSTAEGTLGAAASEHEGGSQEVEGQLEDSDSSVGVYEDTTDDESEEDLESVEGLHNSIQRQRSRLQALMTRVESLQHLAANLEAQEVRVYP